jgi:hypothetical protein
MGIARPRLSGTVGGQDEGVDIGSIANPAPGRCGAADSGWRRESVLAGSWPWRSAAGSRVVVLDGRASAREATRRGQYDRALSFYRDLGPEAFEAEDFSALGTALLEGDHLVLGWTALEAAHRIDPKRGPTNRALDDLHG